MEQQTEIKTRADGSIDTAYYMARGRLARSEKAHEAGRGFGHLVKTIFTLPERFSVAPGKSAKA